MTRRAFLVHGFNDRSEGRNGIDTLASGLEDLGYDVIQSDYGWLGRIGVRICNRSLASMLAHSVRPGDIGIGHSNGCAILHIASHHADCPARFSQMIYVNPALDRDAKLALQVERLDVFHDSSDIWPRIASLIPLSPWGSMGTDGASSGDRRVHNHEHCWGHSGLFKKDPQSIFKVIK